MAVVERDLELDAAEERRGRVEDDPVDAGLEPLGEVGAAVGVRRCGRDAGRVMPQLNRNALGGTPGGGVQHVGRDRCQHPRILPLRRNPART